jgi:hypothetical protein
MNSIKQAEAREATIQEKLSASNYGKRFNDNASSINGYSTNKSLKLDCTSTLDEGLRNVTYANIEVLCTKTGIITGLVMPSLPNNNFHFEVLSPFAEYHNCKKLIDLPNKDLSLLDTGILAGIFITVFTTLGLIITRDSALVTNCILRTCSKDTLLKGLKLANRLTPKSASKLSQLDLDYEVHKVGYSTFETPLINFLKLINEEIVATGEINAIANAAGIITIKHSYTPPVLKNSISSSTKSDHYLAFEKEFAISKAKAKEAMRVISSPLLAMNLQKLVAFTKAALSGRAMLSVNKDTKDKMIAKFNEASLTLPVEMSLLTRNVVSFIEMANNEEDPFGKVSSLLERASDSFEKPRVKSLQELLADKLAMQALTTSDHEMPAISDDLVDEEEGDNDDTDSQSI